MAKRSAPPENPDPPPMARLGYSWRQEIKDALQEVARINRLTRNGQPATGASLSEEIVEQWLVRHGHLSPRGKR
jgi:hypothetical protein